MLMGSRRRKASDDQGRAAAPRPLSRGATAVSAALERAWPLPPRTNYVAVQRGIRVPMSDGTTLLADHYLPIVSRPAATVLVRCPYGRGLADTVRVSLIAAAHRFGRVHRIRLQVAGAAHPRFACNPGNGQVDAAPADFVPTRYAIGLSAGAPSVFLLAAADHATAGPAGKAAVHA